MYGQPPVAAFPPAPASGGFCVLWPCFFLYYKKVKIFEFFLPRQASKYLDSNRGKLYGEDNGTAGSKCR